MNQNIPNSVFSPRNFPLPINSLLTCHTFSYCTLTAYFSYISKDLGKKDEAHTCTESTVLI